jgi:hypothetical protein
MLDQLCNICFSVVILKHDAQCSKPFIGYRCCSSWKAQWKKRKLWWFYNYWPMGNSDSSTSRYTLFISLYFFELGFFCVSSLALCSRFIWLLKCLIRYLLMLHQSSIFCTLKCLMWNTIGVYYMLHVCASVLFILKPVKQLFSTHILMQLLD